MNAFIHSFVHNKGMIPDLILLCILSIQRITDCGENKQWLETNLPKFNCTSFHLYSIRQRGEKERLCIKSFKQHKLPYGIRLQNTGGKMANSLFLTSPPLE